MTTEPITTHCPNHTQADRHAAARCALCHPQEYLEYLDRLGSCESLSHREDCERRAAEAEMAYGERGW